MVLRPLSKRDKEIKAAVLRGESVTVIAHNKRMSRTSVYRVIDELVYRKELYVIPGTVSPRCYVDLNPDNGQTSKNETNGPTVTKNGPLPSDVSGISFAEKCPEGDEWWAAHMTSGIKFTVACEGNYADPRGKDGCCFAYWNAEEPTRMKGCRVRTGDYRTNTHMTLNFETICQVTSSQYSTVYLDLDYLSNLDMSTGGTESAGTIYSDGGAIRSSESTEWTSIVDGKLPIQTLIDAGCKSGWYQLQEGHTYAGPFYPSMNANSAPCSGGAVLIFGDNIGYITIQNGALHMAYNGQNDVDIGYLTVSYDYGQESLYTGGGTSDNYYKSLGENDTILKELISAYAAYYAQLYERLSSASNAAHLMWRIQGEARSSNIFLSPSSVLPQVEELGYDEDVAYILYRAALDESAQWYETYGKVLQDGQMTISQESLKQLNFTGAVYDRNKEKISTNDTSFIPIVYLKDYVLTEGYNEFSEGAGILIGVQTGSIYHLTAGSYFTVDDGGITYNGKAVESITLHVKSIEEIGIHDLNKPIDPPFRRPTTATSSS